MLMSVMVVPMDGMRMPFDLLTAFASESVFAAKHHEQRDWYCQRCFRHGYFGWLVIRR